MKTMKKCLALLLAVLITFALPFRGVLAEQAAPAAAEPTATESAASEETAAAPAESAAPEQAAEAPAEETVEPFTLPQNDQVLAKVNGTEIFGHDVNRLFTNLTTEYAKYGFDVKDPRFLKEMLGLAFQSVVQKTLLLQNAEKLGVGKPSEEELAKLKSDVEARYKEAYDGLIAERTPKDATDEVKKTTKETVDKELAEARFSLEDVIAREIETWTISKVQEAIIKDISVAEDEITSAYEQNVETDKKSFEDNISAYEQKLARGAQVWYTPAGYRGIKHILLKVEEELLNNYNKLKALSEEQSEVHADGAEQKSDENKEKISPEDIEKAQKAILDSVKEKLDEINQKLSEGKSFDELVAEYGTDPGMKREPYMTEGYHVHKDSIIYDSVFTKTAYLLNAVGEHSEPVIGTNGVHILYYNGDIAEGPVPLNNANRDVLQKKALSDKQQEALRSKLEEWTKEANIEYMDPTFQPTE